MATISAADVKSLRDKTNAPMMDCKAALTAADGDMEKAIEVLRTKMKDISVKRGERETAEGRVAAFVGDGQKVGALVEMRCESPPVAKAEHFVQLANQVARQIAETNPKDVETLLASKLFDHSGQTVQERINDVIGLIRENMKPTRFVRYEGLIGEYIHHDGSNGVLLQVEGAQADPALLRDVCMHIAARQPMAALKEEVPADLIAKEQAIAKEQIANDPKNKSKPANILEKIIEGKLKTWYAENVLVEQLFVKDDSKTVGQLLAQNGLKLVRYARYRVGDVS